MSLYDCVLLQPDWLMNRCVFTVATLNSGHFHYYDQRCCHFGNLFMAYPMLCALKTLRVAF